MTLVFAHAGHDHSSSGLSGFDLVMGLASLLVITGVITYWALRAIKKQDKTETSEDEK